MKKYSLPAFALICLIFTACQKQLVNSPGTSASPDPATSIGPLGPPTFLIWSHPTDLPVPSDYYIGWDQGQGFAINGKGYLFCGRYDSKQFTTTYLPMLWEYDPATKVWTPKADFPGGPNIMGCHFVIGSKVYVVIENKCWAWDQTTNVWTQKASLPARSRLNASAFAIKSRGYMGLGSDDHAANFTCLKDWWEYDSNADLWTKKKDFPGAAREYASTFVVSENGYVCSGDKVADRLNPGNDLWQYDPARDHWTQKTAPPITSSLVTAFGLNGVVAGGTPMGFIVQGVHNGCMQYNPATDTWGILPDVPGGTRYGAAGFMIDRALFVAGGTGATADQFRKDVEELVWSR